jgi:hypothetical protein
MSIRTQFEIETFLLGVHPTKSRQAKHLINELNQARAEDHPDLPVLQAVYDEFASVNDVDALLASIESEEEEYWVKRLSRLAAIDILTIGKVQPEHMNYMAALSDNAFAACVKGASQIAKTLNSQVRDIEAELSSELSE